MLSGLFKKRKLEIFAPVNGEIIPLDQVPDPVFSQKMMGEGVAVIPTEGTFRSPVEGTVVLISDSKHAIGLRTSDGTEILIHIGLETVTLQGKGFKALVETGDNVSLAQPLIEVDLDYIREHATSIVTPIIITNSSEKAIQCTHTKDGIAGKTLVMTVSNK
ncbi:PTS sugar transporter subunit IIA [Sporosarcina beigongshangi]|uniref:PTS sugar transporter subunit IIA n=1 Tax=Sporosarcina beigongshangi TaxID=2782538 RepID=UPI0019395909|nr:PTS glucose transporter subunit IIA [Sporosarcina beigongshangi]